MIVTIFERETKMMDKHAYTDMCRYYKGETTCPFCEQNDKMFWDYERWWVESFENEEKHLVLQDAINRYIWCGLESFDESDGTPLSIKALLFNRYEHWAEGTPDDFRKWYRKEFMKTLV